MASTKEKREAAERDNASAPDDETATASEDDVTPPVAQQEEWEEVRVGLGEGWDWEKDPVLVGNFVGATVVQLSEAGLDGRSEATALEFQLDSGEVVFSWASYKLSQALTNIGVGDRVKIEYGGKIGIKDDKQQLRQYRVWKAPAQTRITNFGDTNPLDEA